MGVKAYFSFHGRDRCLDEEGHYIDDLLRTLSLSLQDEAKTVG